MAAEGALTRRPPDASATAYDLIVIGGGIYGAALVLESARRGLRPLLIERDDFGGATSWNSHRILHGGLRYLQRLDRSRFNTSVKERRWFMRHFPDLVEPLPCLMPLYGRGLRRAGIMRIALAANHMLSTGRNDGVRSDRHLESGGVITAAEATALFPGVVQEDLQGAALWYDAMMKSAPRVLMETLRWATAYGAVCINYCEATGIDTDDNVATGVRAEDRQSGEAVTFEAPLVVNCAGPWCGEIAAALGAGTNQLFTPSLSFNLLFDRPAPSEVALAVSRPEQGAHTWFVYPRDGKLYAGTAHFAWDGEIVPPEPPAEQIESVVSDIDAAIPGLDLRSSQIARVDAGLMPALSPGAAQPARRPTIIDHVRAGGPAGVISVSGVKYTTARHVAEKTLRMAFPGRLAPIDPETPRPEPTTVPAPPRPVDDPTAQPAPPAEPESLPVGSVEGLRSFAAQEAVVHLDDLLLRRTSWGEDPDVARRLGPALCTILGWDEEQTAAELARVDTLLRAVR